MAELTTRNVLRSILKGETEQLHRFFDSGLSPESITESERWNLLHQATVSVATVAPVESISLLISKGVNVNAIDTYGNTPLHYSARSKNTASIGALLRAGADPNVLNIEGISPLHQCLLRLPADIDAIEMLLAAGASQDIGTTRAFVLAINNPVITELLGKY